MFRPATRSSRNNGGRLAHHSFATQGFSASLLHLGRRAGSHRHQVEAVVHHRAALRATATRAVGAPDFWDEDTPISREGYSTDLFGERAVTVIGNYARAGRPFLLSLHFNAPHWPWEAPGDQAEAERLRGRDPIYWDGGSQETYRRMIAALDAQVGRVLAALENNGVARDTIVIFTSDNGGERFSDTWPFSGKKSELLEGGLRIPAIVSWTARISAGRVR
jgi:arylsulfatase A-like enzyme